MQHWWTIQNGISYVCISEQDAEKNYEWWNAEKIFSGKKFMV